MRKLVLSLLLVGLASPAFGAGTWHTFIPRSKFHPMVGSSCTSGVLSGGGGIASYNKDVLDCPALNAQAFFGIEFWFPINTSGFQITVQLFGETDQAEAGVWCNIVGYNVTAIHVNDSTDWGTNVGQLGTQVTVGSPVITNGALKLFKSNPITVTAFDILANQDCNSSTQCGGKPGVIFVRRGITGTDSCGAGTDLNHTVHYIGADISGTWP